MAAIAADDLPTFAASIKRLAWALDGRFRVFPQQGVPRTVFERTEDAAAQHLTDAELRSVVEAFGVETDLA
jgi:L-rhamnose isomerase